MRVAIVGGGIAGVMAAWELARSCDVVLIEAEQSLGEHATGRSAATLSETSGTREMCAMARASRGFLEAPPTGFVDHDLTAPRGLLWFGRSGDEPLLDAIEEVAASGVAPSARRVDALEAASIVPVLRPEAVAAGGVWEPDARTVDVAGLLQAAARGAVAEGADLRVGTGLERATCRADGSWTLTTSSTDQLEVDVVIDAAGAWGDAVAARCGVEPIGLSPLRRTACIVPVPAEVSGADSWPLTMDVASRCYFEPEPGGLLLSPADESPSPPVDARAEEEDVAWAIEMLHESTTLQVRTVRSTWAGLRTFAPDRVPVVGADPGTPSFVWLVGQGGAGIKTAPAMARAVASVVLGEPWPDDVGALGVSAAALSPSRLR